MKHVYFDQGGFFGRARMAITTEPLPEPGEDDCEAHMGHYYYGQMTDRGIQGLYYTFMKAWGCSGISCHLDGVAYTPSEPGPG